MDISTTAARYAARLKKRNPRAIKDNSLKNSFSNLINSSLSAIQISFLSDFNSDLVTIPDDSLDVVRDAILEDKIELDKITDAETRKLLVDYSTPVPLGGVFNSIGADWLVARNEPLTNTAYKRYQVKKCNYTLKWIDAYGIKQQQKCIVYDYTLYSDGIDERVGITTGNSKIGVLIPLTNHTKAWKRDDRFLIGNVAYKLSKEDDFTNQGIKTAVMREVETSSRDDLINGYAYDEKVSVYTLNFSIDDTELKINQTARIMPIVTKDGNTVETDLVWNSSNTDIATIDDDGLIHGIEAGTTVIEASLKGSSDIKDYFVLHVQTSTTPSYYYDFIGSTELKYGMTKSYELCRFVNGVKDLSFATDLVYSVDNDDYVVLTDNNDNSCSLKSKTYNQEVTLSVTYDGKLYSKTIQLKSLL